MIVSEGNRVAMPIAEETVVEASEMTARIVKDVVPHNEGQRIAEEIAYRVVEQPADSLACSIEDWFHGRRTSLRKLGQRG